MDIYRENTISNFVNHLASSIYLQGEYKLGVRSVGYHKSWGNIRSQNGVLIAIHLKPRNLNHSPGLETFVFPEGYYKSIHQIFESLFFLSPRVKGISLSDLISYTYDEGARRIRVTMKQKYSDTYQSLQILVLNQESEAQDNIGASTLSDMLGMVKATPHTTLRSYTTYDNPFASKPLDKQVVGVMEVGYKKFFRNKTMTNFANEYDTFLFYAPNLIASTQMKDTTAPLLAVLPVGNKGRDNEYLHYEIENVTWHRCILQLITDIGIRVEDVNQHLIAFNHYVGPVVLGLRFEPMNSINLELASFSNRLVSYEQHYVYLISDSSRDRYPRNKPESFTNHLISPLMLSNSWEVGICQVTYSRPFHPDQSTTQVMIKAFFKNGASRQIFIDITEEFYFSKESLANCWNSTMIDLNEHVQQIPLEEICSMKYLNGPSRFALCMNNQDKYNLLIMQVHFTPHNASNVGFGLFAGAIVNPERHEEHTLNLSIRNNSVLLRAPPDMQNSTFNLWITAPDLVGTTRVGSVLMPLIDVLPLQGDFNSKVQYSYKYPNYKPLSKSTDLSDITIEIKNSLGALAYLDNDSQVWILLHFRRKF